jgi:hypothetical protein
MITTIIKHEETKKNLSAMGGIHLASRVMKLAQMNNLVLPHLPQLKQVKAATGADKFRALVLGFIADAQCLDDMADLGTDVAFSAVAGHVNAPNTYGQFLKQFSAVQCRQLNASLIDYSLNIRKAAKPDAKEFILDIDSTSHEQYGKKMEGVECNYKHQWALDSIQAFDQFGFQYWMDVRPGATYTSNGSGEIIHSVFSKVDRKTPRLLRADSGFCNTEVFNACAAKGVKFVTAMRQNMLASNMHRITKWNPTRRVIFKGDHTRLCEIGHTVYRTKESHEALRLVVLRSPAKDNSLLDAYDHVAFVTNIGEHEMSDDKVVEFYRGRGNAENFIREIKNGFDLHHFPCRELTANKAYGLMAAFAFSTMRFLLYVDKPKHAHFSKMIRRKMIFKAVEVVKHAREVTFRFSHHQLKEVEYWLKTIHIKFELALLKQQRVGPRFLKTS